MRSYRPHIALVVLWFALADGYQAILYEGGRGLLTKRMFLYMFLHVLAISWSVWALRSEWRSGGLFARMRKVYQGLPIPRTAKTIFLFILVLEVIHISEGRIRYPFDDVGMFRYAKRTAALPTVLVLPKYYYKADDGTPVPLEIRKQHIFFAADLLGWTYNNEFTFSATYHYKGLKANYDHLLTVLEREAGIDSLWVGLQTVDYATGRVTFDPDPLRAIQFNDTAKIFYGPIHIPDHQRSKMTGSWN